MARPETTIASQYTPERLFFRLYQASNISLRRAAQILDEFNLSAQQLSVLGSLSRPGFEAGMTVSELVDYLLVSRQSLNGVLNRMEAAGYVRRMVNADDQRSRRVVLSPLGREVFRKMRPRMLAFYRDSLSDMSEQEQEDGIRSLNSIIERMTGKSRS
ncbi:MAG: MarR family winged helix-turn-helix transcriptional regulator [Pseudomonadota bacterium]|jgi:DNA-binding MarR family transcriptional regulator